MVPFIVGAGEWDGWVDNGLCDLSGWFVLFYHFLGFCKQLCEIIIHTRHPEIRLALEETPHIVYPVRAIQGKLDNGQNKVVRLIERVEWDIRDISLLSRLSFIIGKDN